jgi:glycosyltransferase involved in cell wall biosynthesis
MKLVAGIPTKNEEWIIKKTLDVLITFCDKIIILDDNSDDNTEFICSQYHNVVFIKRDIIDICNTGMSATGKQELFNHMISYEPEYILMLDADEIPTPTFIPYFDNIYNNPSNIVGWRPVFINLFNDNKHYRVDSFTTSHGINIDWNPYSKDAWKKTVLLKYNAVHTYTYNLSNIIGGISNNHPFPEDLYGDIIETDEFNIIHYGKLNPKYINGEKHKQYALIESRSRKLDYNQQLLHHMLCNSNDTLALKRCLNEWFWI